MRLDIDRNDDWYESEESTRKGMVAGAPAHAPAHARAAVAGARARQLLITGALTYKLATRKQTFDAEVVLALREGTLGTHERTGMPLGELKELVGSVLLPDNKLEELIERRNLHRLAQAARHAVGDQRAARSAHDRGLAQLVHLLRSRESEPRSVGAHRHHRYRHTIRTSRSRSRMTSRRS